MKISDMDESLIYSVTQINEYVKKVLKEDENLRYVLVRGEVSNFKSQPKAGHMYFSLKDEESLVNVTFFSMYNRNLDFTIQDGMEVVVLASVDLYTARGSYQLNAYQVEEVGTGKALMELEKLRKQLASEGLFDPERKRKTNTYPTRIGVISGKGSAAITDITTNIYRRYKPVEIYFFPSQVQGESAPKDLLRAFKLSQTYDLDTLIISRGGGASEDLGAFNDETFVRAVANSNCPVIAAVGHEVDVTLVELVADLRVSTPTGAAEAAVADTQEIEQRLFDTSLKIKEVITNKVDDIKADLEFSKKQISNTLTHKVEILRERFNSKKALVESLNPYGVISRGYTITYDKNGKVVKSIKDVNINDEIRTVTSDGTITSNVTDKKEK